ncbi:uncharacterized protein COLE_04236 [Cutaneotrichosporon oleaginosum]|uniref:uncharacterized protein n=1 Tax=Cutaneotrichosporon oleaginosum TaxID=879819 RepID=UPI00132A2981|nr:hypothetical protein COLE_04236 [Cutaneotrichosporon oleaginosum]
MRLLPQTRGPLFLVLNVLRALSILALVLVFSSTVVTIVDDIKAVKADKAASTAAAPVYTCDYYKGSTVPLQAGGTFWSVLARVFILGECILLALSEIGFPAAFFANIIPMLGEEYGLGCLGVLQALIASSVLAHHCRRFAQVFAWLLFIVAMINVLVGIFFRDKAKQHRAMSWENAAELTPQTRAAAAAWNIGSSVHESVRDWRARNASATAARTEASRPSFYSQNTPAPTVAPTAAPTPGPGRKRFSWDTSPRWSGFPWGRQKEPPVISRPYETMPSV